MLVYVPGDMTRMQHFLWGLLQALLLLQFFWFWCQNNYHLIFYWSVARWTLVCVHPTRYMYTCMPVCVCLSVYPVVQCFCLSLSLFFSFGFFIPLNLKLRRKEDNRNEKKVLKHLSCCCCCIQVNTAAAPELLQLLLQELKRGVHPPGQQQPST